MISLIAGKSYFLKWIKLELIDSLKAHLVPLFILLLFTSATYCEVLTHSFLVNWDDPGYITQNPAIQGFTWQNLYTAFTSQYVGNYAPVQIVSYMLDYSLWGLNPFGFLLANISYHFLSGVLLYFLLVRHGFPQWGAATGTLLFLVHPVQMESVAWMAQRKTLLAMLFYLMAFHLWISYRRHIGDGAWKLYLATLLLSVLSLLAKSVAVIFPLMLILYDQLVLPVPRRLREHADKIPFLAVAGVVGIVTMCIQNTDAVGGRVGYPENALVTLPMTMLPVLVKYLRLLLWPEPSTLSVFYSVLTKTGIDVEVISAMAVVAGVVVFGFWLYRNYRPGLFWYALFFLGLLPVSQIVPIVTKMNERYLYFPMLGIAGLICISSSQLWVRLQSTLAKRAIACGVVAVIAALAVACHIRGRVWKDTVTLFSDMVEKAPYRYETWDGLAEGYRLAGDKEMALHCYEMASKYGLLREVESFHLAQIYLERGDYELAHRHIWGLLLRNNKSGNRDGYLLLGEYYLLTGAYADAEKQLSIYLEAVPDSPKGLLLFGKVCFMTEHFDKAKDFYRKAMRTAGDSVESFYAAACLASLEGDIESSLRNIQRVLEKGGTNRDLLEQDKTLMRVQRDPRFGQLITTYLVKIAE